MGERYGWMNCGLCCDGRLLRQTLKEGPCAESYLPSLKVRFFHYCLGTSTPSFRS